MFRTEKLQLLMHMLTECFYSGKTTQILRTSSSVQICQLISRAQELTRDRTTSFPGFSPRVGENPGNEVGDQTELETDQYMMILH